MEELVGSMTAIFITFNRYSLVVRNNVQNYSKNSVLFISWSFLGGCHLLTFCSEDCEARHWNRHHKDVCRYIGSLIQKMQNEHCGGDSNDNLWKSGQSCTFYEPAKLSQMRQSLPRHPGDYPTWSAGYNNENYNDSGNVKT